MVDAVMVDAAMEVSGVRPAAPAGGTRTARTSSGFAVGEGRAAAPSPGAPAAVDGMLALQELADASGPDPMVRDRQARRHGRAMLDALRDMQLAMLAGDCADAAARLAALAGQGVDAADPALQAILSALAVRAQVELARRGL